MAGLSAGSQGQVRVWAPRTLLLLKAAGPSAMVAIPLLLIASLMALAAVTMRDHPVYLPFFAVMGLAFGSSGIASLKRARQLVRPAYLTTDEEGMAMTLQDGETRTIRWNSIAMAKQSRARQEFTPWYPVIQLWTPEPTEISLVGYSRACREDLMSLITARSALRHDPQSDVWFGSSSRVRPYLSATGVALGIRWNQLTEQAKKAFVSAQEHAEAAGGSLISPEHLLLALLGAEESVLVRLLLRQGVDVVRIREGLEKQSAGRSKAACTGLDVRTHRVLVLAGEDAFDRQNGYIGTEHILLGIAGEGKGVAFELLSTHGLRPDDLRRLIDDHLAGVTDNTAWPNASG